MGDAVDLTLFNALSLLLPPFNELYQDLEQQRNNERKIINNVLDPKIYDSSMPFNPPAEVLPLFFVDHVESLNEDQQLMILHGGILLMWLDKRISWNSTQYGNIKEITRRKSQLDGRVWLPKVYLTEIFFRTSDILNFETSELTISSTGQIRCTVNVLVKTSCHFEYDEYPFDRQNCSFTMYSPYTADKMRFIDFGNSERTHYQTKSGNPSKVDVGDFALEKIESRNIYLIPGSKVVGSLEKYPAKMVRSVFWYNLVFRRHNVYYITRMALPLFSISCLSYAFSLFRSPNGLIWLLFCLAVQIMNGAILLKSLPPDYTKMPTVGLIATLVLFETICLLIWRFFTVFVLQISEENAHFRGKLDLAENFLCLYLVIRIIHIYMKLF
ncbi:Neurotransmitter-gated ion-channel ligand binding domain protein [Dictyocaulus viviparus]|uniref:Neurotransmitter-gated ion-channel ligand binding domain protein n=1 Tax=Dictyocaulus viviparus TaxID=29172 RepID=A0A0D8XP40_DICVI|nr:Neurotransmitter-gated ion-channel ligand binding domain protein [Dictyocaulus viviparus]